LVPDESIINEQYPPTVGFRSNASAGGLQNFVKPRKGKRKIKARQILFLQTLSHGNVHIIHLRQAWSNHHNQFQSITW
jgi:hypothetical protein